MINSLCRTRALFAILTLCLVGCGSSSSSSPDAAGAAGSDGAAGGTAGASAGAGGGNAGTAGGAAGTSAAGNGAGGTSSSDAGSAAGSDGGAGSSATGDASADGPGASDASSDVAPATDGAVSDGVPSTDGPTAGTGTTMKATVGGTPFLVEKVVVQKLVTGQFVQYTVTGSNTNGTNTLKVVIGAPLAAATEDVTCASMPGKGSMVVAVFDSRGFYTTGNASPCAGSFTLPGPTAVGRLNGTFSATPNKTGGGTIEVSAGEIDVDVQ